MYITTKWRKTNHPPHHYDEKIDRDAATKPRVLPLTTGGAAGRDAFLFSSRRDSRVNFCILATHLDGDEPAAIEGDVRTATSVPQQQQPIAAGTQRSVLEQ